ncbi:opsin, ultraviolet-sensitive-like [Rhopalosiphum maidis]|uniref:opsin, ultraviolet-sensitive-like n=1 Tax=Rhopalosiphum maidis TaxID=43146 RepID=UPI000F003C3F|nr:opsin, ultraviolet-sensitive-like [Rhopalosiphum maidis]
MDFNRSVSRPLSQLGSSFMENEDELQLMGWNLTPEDLTHIPEHWLSYPEVRSLYHYILAFAYTILFSLGVIGNGLVLWIFCVSKPLRTPSNLFVLNLALCDFSMVLVLPILIYDSINHKYPGHLQCQIFALCGSISGIGAGATNAAIAYDRYSTIAKPFEGRMTYGKALILIICIWIYVLPWCILPLTEKWNRFVPEGFLTSCSFDYLTPTEETKAFVATMFVICYVIPMSFIIYFYSQIVCHVFNHEKALREQAKKMNVESLRSNQDANAQSAEVRIAKAAITICFLFVAAWTPYAIVAMIGAFGDQSLLTPIASMLPAVFAKTVACFDPYVYAISHPKYRLELSKRVPCLGINEKPPATSDTQSITTAA